VGIELWVGRTPEWADVSRPRQISVERVRHRESVRAITWQPPRRSLEIVAYVRRQVLPDPSPGEIALSLGSLGKVLGESGWKTVGKVEAHEGSRSHFALDQ
jgi:hypothetical protein